MTDSNHPTYGPSEVTILANCAKQFRFYEQNHRTKNTEESLVKAEVNADLASQIETFLADYDAHRIERIARTCHEAVRVYAISLGDHSIKPWDDAPEWQTTSAMNGVMFHLVNPDAGDSASHDNWMREKVETGWTYGEVKDEEAKTHPCLLPFEELPPEQQFKDTLFRTIIHAASKD